MKRRDFLYTTTLLGAAMAGHRCAPAEREEGSETGLDESKLNEAEQFIQTFVDDGRLRSAALQVTQDAFTLQRAFGEVESPETIFLLASISKPLTAIGMMVLADRGELQLSDPVHKFIPEFTEGDRKLITIKDILSHTSGLPDQLPENVELRKRHAPLSEFVERAIKTPLLFKPGTQVEYQSMGFLLASEVAQRITETPFREFLRDHVFRPLDVNNTALGVGDFEISETAQSQVEHAPALYGGGGDTESWDWNSPYWRDLGAPWGGAHSTCPDLTKLLKYFLDPDDRVLQPETARSMLVNQNEGLDQPWGIGFKLTDFGKACSPGTFGHSGATGTLFWADPVTRLTFVFLTTFPARVSREILINPVSDLVSEAAV